MPRVRFTVRRLMIAVAIVALLGYGARTLKDRRARFEARATEEYWLFIDASAYNGSWPTGTPWPPPQSNSKSRHHEKLAAKYRHATRYPWLPVEPDPPEPE